MKKQLGAIAVLSVVMFGTVAGAEQRTSPPKAAGVPTPTESFVLRVGEKKRIEVPDVARVAVGDTSVVEMTLLRQADQPVLQLTGDQPGQTLVTLWPKKGTARTYEVVVVK